MAIDIERARAETPGVAEVLHFNAAGASLMPRVVLEAQIGHLEREARRGGYEAAEAAAPSIERCYHALSELVNCAPEEIALMENATAAWNMAFHAFRFRAGDRILTAEAEYASNYISYLKCARRSGARVEVIPSDESGELSLSALDSMIDERVKLISITHVPTNGGLVNPAAGVGRIARRAGIPYLLDACQSVGQMPLDVAEIGCDLLSATGRKYLRGPRGSGFLYVGRSILDKIEPPFLDLHGAEWTARDSYVMRPDARRFENWEFNYAAVIGLGAAVDYALAWGVAAIEARVAALAESLRGRLASLEGLRLHDLGRKPCGIVSFSLEGRDPEALRRSLARRNINISTSSAAGTRIDAERRQLPLMLRASPHYYNTEEEIDRFIEALGP